MSWPVTSNDDTLEDGVTYTVSFNVKPTQAAFDEAVKNHKDDANASGDNNFYTNDNSSATVDYKTVVTDRRLPAEADHHPSGLQDYGDEDLVRRQRESRE